MVRSSAYDRRIELLTEYWIQMSALAPQVDQGWTQKQSGNQPSEQYQVKNDANILWDVKAGKKHIQWYYHSSNIRGVASLFGSLDRLIFLWR